MLAAPHADPSTAASARPHAALPRLLIFVVLAAACAAGWHFFGPRDALADAGWTHNWDAALQQSRADGKPALVLFTADWCPACREFEADALSDAKVLAHLKANYTLVVVDLSDRAGANNDRAQACNVRAIPTLILYDRAGQESARTHGIGPDALLTWLHANTSRGQ
jgi:thiol:disulfide interchange protein DsbD